MADENLSEKDFIQEGYKKNPFPFWLWLFLIVAFTAIVWGGNNWYQNQVSALVRISPFLQVTNREMSLFLWQNPEFMRVNSKEKSGYLPGFQYINKVTIDLPYADQYVSAPPELLFRYHTWKRLVSAEFTQRPIPRREFRDFLSYVEEWLPAYWPGATPEYKQMVEGLPSSQVEDLSRLSLQALPMPVRMAFQGWRNYFLEGEAINELKPTVLQTRQFIEDHPHYARNFWRNIVADEKPNYLKSVNEKKEDTSLVPTDELTAFLRVALYNYIAKLGK